MGWWECLTGVLLCSREPQKARADLTLPPHSFPSTFPTSCSVMLCQPTGGKAKLTPGCSFRRKDD